MGLPRALFAVVAGAAPLQASSPEPARPPSAASWVNLVQTAWYVRDHRGAGAVERPGAEGAPGLRAREPAAAQAGAAGTSVTLRGARQKPEPLAAISTGVGARARSGTPMEAGWFQAFSEGESTYDTDGELQSSGWDSRGWAPGGDLAGRLPPLGPTPVPGKWFQESKSGGPMEAWQTFYPPVPATMPRGQPTPEWRESVYGGVQQDFDTYRVAEQAFHWTQATEGKSPMWFDTAVGEYDAFGRNRAPSPHSQRRYIEWDRRTEKVNLTCGSVGCVANATFPKLFNHSEEQRRMCQLSIAVHATDFDDEYNSRERVEFFKANGETVGVNCNPMASGNTEEAQNALYPCVNELDVDTIIKDDGQLFVEGKLSPMVDEFPRNGNLLDGEATVSCLVRKRPEWHPAQEDLAKINESMAKFNETLAKMFEDQNFSARFGCTQPGCAAEATLEVGESMLNRTCRLTVKISQTDFDDDLGTTEQIDFLKVNGKTIGEAVRPGKNPCKQAAELGQLPPNTSQPQSRISDGVGVANVSDDGDAFVLADGLDVSEEAKTGKITIASKISDAVDECGHQGFLLIGIAIVQCEVDEQQHKDIEAVLERKSSSANSTSDASADVGTNTSTSSSASSGSANSA